MAGQAPWYVFFSLSFLTFFLLPITLLLWYRFVASLGMVDYGQGDINLHLEKCAIRATVSLYDFLIKVPLENEIPRDELAVHVHRVLGISLFCMGRLSDIC
jgi:hypothetical protein